LAKQGHDSLKAEGLTGDKTRRHKHRTVRDRPEFFVLPASGAIDGSVSKAGWKWLQYAVLIVECIEY
jgi:hypothetical protein